MKKVYKLSLGMAGLWLTGPVTAQDSAEATAESRAAPIPNANDYICTFKTNVSRGSVEQETAKAVGPELGQVLHTYKWAVKGFAVRLPATPTTKSVTARLKLHNPNVSGCEHDGITRAALFFGRPGGGGGGSTQAIPWGVTRVGGAGNASTSTARAWIIDSGIDLTHPDLNVDTLYGKSFLTDTSLNDTYGHGTHVAGIIGAKNNTIGVVGVAAGVRVVPVRVLDGRGTGPDSGVIAAIDYVASKAVPGDVANLSLIADAVSTTMDTAVQNLGAKGVYVTIAAGNNSANAANYSPGRASGGNVYTVSAFASGDTWASFSNYGLVVGWGEPGVNIRSTYKGGTYATLSGTSMAAPHLAGILLLLGPPPPAPAQVTIHQNGSVAGDPDGNPDPIGVR